MVAQLREQPQRLHEYLHALYLQDPHLGAPFHGMQLELYASLAPQLLLPFLRASTHYALADALAVCEAHNLVDAQIFVLGRMGSNREALLLILEVQSDMGQAIEYVQGCGDDELWGLLLDHAMRSAGLTSALLQHLCASPLASVNPLTLVRRLPEATRIYGLKGYAQQLLQQVTNQLELLEGALAGAEAECASLSEACHRLRAQGERLDALPPPPPPRWRRAAECDDETLEITERGVQIKAKDTPP